MKKQILFRLKRRVESAWIPSVWGPGGLSERSPQGSSRHSLWLWSATSRGKEWKETLAFKRCGPHQISPRAICFKLSPVSWWAALCRLLTLALYFHHVHHCVAWISSRTMGRSPQMHLEHLFYIVEFGGLFHREGTEAEALFLNIQWYTDSNKQYR